MSSWVRLVYLLGKLGHYDYSSDLTPGVIRSPGGIAIQRTVRAGRRRDAGHKMPWTRVSPGHLGCAGDEALAARGEVRVCVYEEQGQGMNVRNRLHLDTVSQTYTKKWLQFKETVAYKSKHGWKFLFSVFV